MSKYYPSCHGLINLESTLSKKACLLFLAANIFFFQNCTYRKLPWSCPPLPQFVIVFYILFYTFYLPYFNLIMSPNLPLSQSNKPTGGGSLLIRADLDGGRENSEVLL